jgi:hypothetical protein
MTPKRPSKRAGFFTVQRSESRSSKRRRAGVSTRADALATLPLARRKRERAKVKPQ